MKMRGHSRRLLSVLLALVMLLSLLPTAVFAATPKAKLVTDASELKAGDQIILTATANSKTYVAGSLSGKYLTSIETDPPTPLPMWRFSPWAVRPEHGRSPRPMASRFTPLLPRP